MQSPAIWYDVMTCREKFESSKAKWCILTLFATYARRHMPMPGNASAYAKDAN